MKQKDIFLSEEGNQWFLRNKSAKARHDNLNTASIIEEFKLPAKRVLEIGCGDGRQLAKIQALTGAACFGIDPSADAINHGSNAYPELTLSQGTAETLPYCDKHFDTIIFGFCLYLCDRNDLFRIAMEADRCLDENGVIVIHDFYPPFAYKNGYSHYEGVYSFKMDYSRMFSWNPAYTELAKIISSHNGFAERNIPDERLAITVLQKNTTQAYPASPFNAEK